MGKKSLDPPARRARALQGALPGPAGPSPILLLARNLTNTLPHSFRHGTDGYITYGEDTPEQKTTTGRRRIS
eukprot:653666-Pyramimonas_sp.AAC.1